jgi:protein TonB
MMVEKQPEFPGGEENLKKFLSDNVQYPQLAKENGIEGTVVVSFVVRKNGKLSDIKVVKSLGSGCDEQAIAAIKAMPRWIPGEQSGRKVDVRFNLPIVFKIK